MKEENRTLSPIVNCIQFYARENIYYVVVECNNGAIVRYEVDQDFAKRFLSCNPFKIESYDEKDNIRIEYQF